MLKRAQRRLIKLDAQAAALQCELGGLVQVDEFVELEEQGKSLAARVLGFLLKSQQYAPAVLSTGRLIAVSRTALGGAGAAVEDVPAVVLEYRPPSAASSTARVGKVVSLVLCPDSFVPPKPRGSAAVGHGSGGHSGMGMGMGMGSGSGVGGGRFGGMVGRKKGGEVEDEWGAVGGRGKKKRGKKGRGGGEARGGRGAGEPNPFVKGWFDRIGGTLVGIVECVAVAVACAGCVCGFVRACVRAGVRL